MIYVLIFIAAILMFGGAAVGQFVLAVIGAIALACFSAYLGVGQGWPTWLVLSTLASPIVLILVAKAYFDISDNIRNRRREQKLRE